MLPSFVNQPQKVISYLFFTLIPFFCIWLLGFQFIRESVYREKVTKVIETLLATPCSLKEIWLAKTIAIFLISYFLFF
jgi:ABC-type Na+ efflux pump permease subunit